MNLLDFMPTSQGESVDWKAIEKRYTWPAEMLNTPQDPRHHAEGDVWTHTKMVTEALLGLSEFWSLDEVGKQVTFASTILHDIAKPATTVHQPDGSITSHGHSKRGAIDARILLWREGVPFFEREMISRIIGVHQAPFFTMVKDDGVFKMRKMSHEVRLDYLGLMAQADALGRFTNPPQARQETLDNVELFQLACKDDGIESSPFPAADSETWMRYLDVKGERVDPVYKIPNLATGSRVYMMSGLPGMGKDTWIKNHASDLPVISFDAMRAMMEIEHNDNPGAMVQAVKEEAKKLLRDNKPFIWNATNISPAMREKTIGLLRAYGAFITTIYVEASDEKRWRQQNRSRAASVPDKALDKMLFKWEVPTENETHSIEYWIDGQQVKII